MRVNLEARAALAGQRRARTRDRLLIAAEAVIAEKGLHGGSIEEFARAAGVSRGTFYNYFPTTTDLISALNRRVARDMAGLLAEIVKRPADPAARLAASLHTMLAAYHADPLRGWVALQLASTSAPRVSAYEEVFATLYREGVARGQFRDVDLVAAVTLCFGTLRMALRDVAAGEPAAQPEELVAMLLTAYGLPFEAALAISCEQCAAAKRGQARDALPLASLAS
ncbi:TetR/AcrR family transcriptional regulator [Phenylobacterium sp.]|jgi:AcrR family transcriptional regulator|uniref:TetR/AcrR family transcriptional regulator n=1 Tax=Phenylobacterium sp. TaxID=1871053 RepID=UPI002E351636|nr:TetR/AcrR family transcriptional regulator [Phenylobacterium sp.]HEX3367701.1 TetR/AcrR family transcriptional regulator [Phenylobacterium sp.]